jgi:hemerythrin-like domain-containing protein
MADVVDMIMNDHREVERMFDQLMDEPDKRSLVLPVVTALLIAHSRAEEAEVYPAARDEAGESDEVEHSQAEHVEADQMLEELAGMDPGDPGFESKLQELIDAVKHHVEEEESSVLPGLRANLSAARLAELGEAFAQQRAEHLGEMPGEATRDELLVQAQNSGIEGAGSMSKTELKRALQAKADEEEEDE